MNGGVSNSERERLPATGNLSKYTNDFNRAEDKDSLEKYNRNWFGSTKQGQHRSRPQPHIFNL